MHTRKIFIIVMLLALTIERTGLAQEGRARVEIVSADFSSDKDAKDRLFAVVIRLGSKVIWKTPFVRGDKPRWNKTVSLSSRFGNAIVLEVFSVGKAKGCTEKAKNSDKILSEALNEMVGDYQDNGGSACHETEKAVKEELYCRTSAGWPKKVQSLVLTCGAGKIEMNVKGVEKAKTP